MKSKQTFGALTLVSLFAATGAYAADAGIAIVGDDIGGVVKSSKGPEAGVWVIAETHDLKTPCTKIVVTDDQGRYVLPELPKAKYKVWVRGYGLVDSNAVEATPGNRVDLTAAVAPDAKAAAEIYPANYWSRYLAIFDGVNVLSNNGHLRLRGIKRAHREGKVIGLSDRLGDQAQALTKWRRNELFILWHVVSR